MHSLWAINKKLRDISKVIKNAFYNVYICQKTKPHQIFTILNFNFQFIKRKKNQILHLTIFQYGQKNSLDLLF